ncbi:MAG: hypothetical protein LBJ58_03920 [Tannerellaceae bacterium]|jgi:hypothetical protein|nr:hypothetical protein [Tannerellaceae bacterium]
MFLKINYKKKLFFILCAALHLTSGSAQINIGSQSPPHPSAALEVSATDKGVLLPSVALKSNADKTVIENGNPVNGLLVFNTTESESQGLYKGLYAWNETKSLWDHIVSERTFNNMLYSYYPIEKLYFAADVKIDPGQAIAGSYPTLTFEQQYIVINQDNCFNVSTNCFTVPETGVYKIMCGLELMFNAGQEKDIARAILSLPSKNITSEITRGNIATNRYLTPSIIYINKLEKGTKITVAGWSSSASKATRKYFYVYTY